MVLRKINKFLDEINGPINSVIKRNAINLFLDWKTGSISFSNKLARIKKMNDKKNKFKFLKILLLGNIKKTEKIKNP